MRSLFLLNSTSSIWRFWNQGFYLPLTITYSYMTYEFLTNLDTAIYIIIMYSDVLSSNNAGRKCQCMEHVSQHPTWLKSMPMFPSRKSSLEYLDHFNLEHANSSRHGWSKFDSHKRDINYIYNHKITMCIFFLHTIKLSHPWPKPVNNGKLDDTDINYYTLLMRWWNECIYNYIARSISSTPDRAYHSILNLQWNENRWHKFEHHNCTLNWE